jgi:hypothetical protein
MVIYVNFKYITLFFMNKLYLLTSSNIFLFIDKVNLSILYSYIR